MGPHYSLRISDDKGIQIAVNRHEAMVLLTATYPGGDWAGMLTQMDVNPDVHFSIATPALQGSLSALSAKSTLR